MHPILFTIGKLTFYTHGVVAVLGIILGTILIYYLAPKSKLDTAALFDNIVFTVLAGIIGARLSYFVIYHDQFSSFSQLFRIWEGGMVSYGGFFLGLLAFVLLIKFQKQPLLKWLDVLSIGFFLGEALGRVGNLFAGEWAGVYSASRFLTVGDIFGNYGLVPIPFFEGILCLLIFAIALIVYIKRTNKLTDGTIFLSTIAAYSGLRAVIDYWRDEPQILFHLSLGQIVGVLVFLISIVMLYLVKSRRIWNGKV